MLSDPECRHEVLRLAELQSDDFHLDRPLFFACRADREKFCHAVQSGEGRVFQCLIQHKDQVEMTPEVIVSRCRALFRKASFLFSAKLNCA